MQKVCDVFSFNALKLPDPNSSLHIYVRVMYIMLHEIVFVNRNVQDEMKSSSLIYASMNSGVLSDSYICYQQWMPALK